MLLAWARAELLHVGTGLGGARAPLAFHCLQFAPPFLNQPSWVVLAPSTCATFCGTWLKGWRAVEGGG
jgi:hypothetical protein